MPNMLQGERAVQAIEHGLLRGKWLPGERISIESVARNLGMSRTPVREAFSELVAHGVLERRAGVGTCIASVSPERLAKLWELHTALEGIAARWLAQEATEYVLAGLAAEAAQLDDFLATAYEQVLQIEDAAESNGLRCRVDEMEDQFHGHFVESAGSQDLARAWNAWRNIIVISRAAVATAGLFRHAGSPPPHRALMRAVASRDPDLAQEAVQKHLQRGKDTILLALASQSAPAAPSEALED